VFPGIHLTKSEVRLLPKGYPFLKGEERFRIVTPSIRFLLGSFSKECFQVPFFKLLKSLARWD